MLIECKTFRYEPHATVFPPALHPAPKDEVDEWKRRDPINRLRDQLIEKKVMTEKDDQTIQSRVRGRVKDALRFALNAE